MFWKIAVNLFLIGLLNNTIPLITADSQSADFSFPKRDWDNKIVDIEISAKSAIAIDVKTNKILYSKNLDQQFAIASLTKIMTALVFLEQNPDLNDQWIMDARDDVWGNNKYVRPGEKVYVRDLFNLALVTSANNAATSLARITGLSTEEFVKLMNEKAKEMDLKNTHFADLAGLSKNNISTAKEIAQIMQNALKLSEIKKALSKGKYDFVILDSGLARRAYSTNKLFNNGFFDIEAAKTGTTDEAGFCFVAVFDNKKNNEVIIVNLGSDSQENRFQDAKNLAWLVFQNFKWRQI